MEALEVEEEEEDLVEVEDKSLVTTMDSKETMQEIVPTPLQYVSIANPMTIFITGICRSKMGLLRETIK